MKKSVIFISALIFLFLIGFVISASDDLGIGKTVVDKDGNVKVNGNEYNIKSGSQLIVGKDGLTDGTKFTAGKDGGTYRLKGVDMKLPENSKVTFENNKITIELPKGAKLETVKVIEREKAIGTKFEFKGGDEGFKLPDGSLFTGKTLTFEVGKDGKNNLYFSDKEANLGGLKINNPKQERIDLDLNGKVSKDYAGNYISIDSEKSKTVIGKNSPGAGVEVQKQGENVVYQAGKDATANDKAGKGTIVIDESGKKPIVSTYGDFKISNGEMYFNTNIDSKGKKSVFADRYADRSGQKSSIMEIKSYDENGNLLLENRKIVSDDKNAYHVYRIKSETAQTTQTTTPSQSEEKPRVSFNEMPAPVGGQISQLQQNSHQTVQQNIPNRDPFEDSTYNAVNSQRNNYRGASLEWNDKISEIARAHSVDMSGRGVQGIGHWGSNQRFNQIGGSGFAENVAAFGSYEQLSDEQVAQKFTNMWMNSPGHRVNIMGGYVKTGVGIYVKDFGNGYKEYYATQLFNR